MSAELALVPTEQMNVAENVMMTGRELTRTEAEFLTGACSRTNRVFHSLLLALFEGKAHKALGYGDFETYAKQRLQVDLTERSIRNHLAQARVERNIFSKEEIIASFGGRPHIPMTAAIQLNKLPAAEQQSVWKQAQLLTNDGENPLRALTEIVSRQLRIKEFRETFLDFARRFVAAYEADDKAELRALFYEADKELEDYTAEFGGDFVPVRVEVRNAAIEELRTLHGGPCVSATLVEIVEGRFPGLKGDVGSFIQEAEQQGFISSFTNPAGQVCYELLEA